MNIEVSTTYADDGNLPRDRQSMVKAISRPKATMLDLYAGCGAMSSGLSIGALLGGVDVTAVKNINMKLILSLFSYSKCLKTTNSFFFPSLFLCDRDGLLTLTPMHVIV